MNTENNVKVYKRVGEEIQADVRLYRFESSSSVTAHTVWDDPADEVVGIAAGAAPADQDFVYVRPTTGPIPVDLIYPIKFQSPEAQASELEEAKKIARLYRANALELSELVEELEGEGDTLRDEAEDLRRQMREAASEVRVAVTFTDSGASQFECIACHATWSDRSDDENPVECPNGCNRDCFE